MPPKATQKIRNKSQVRSNPYPNSSQSRSASPLSRELRSLNVSASPLNSSRPGTSSSPVTTTSNHRSLRVAAMENFHRSRLANAQSNARGRGSRGGRGGRGRGGTAANVLIETDQEPGLDTVQSLSVLLRFLYLD